MHMHGYLIELFLLSTSVAAIHVGTSVQTDLLHTFAWLLPVRRAMMQQPDMMMNLICRLIITHSGLVNMIMKTGSLRMQVAGCTPDLWMFFIVNLHRV